MECRKVRLQGRISVDLIAPYAVFLDGVEVARHATAQQAQDHYQQLVSVRTQGPQLWQRKATRWVAQMVGGACVVTGTMVRSGFARNGLSGGFFFLLGV